MGRRCLPHRLQLCGGALHSPFWQTWDLLLLWLAQLHGGNGLRTIIDDYARKDSTRFWLNTLLGVSMVFTLVLGHPPPVPESAVMVTLRIARFDPEDRASTPIPAAGKASGSPACPTTGCSTC